MARSAGQLPNHLNTGHTHLKSEIIDDETREPAEFPEGGSSLTVDNTVDEPAEVIRLVAAGATLDSGTATLAASQQTISRLDAVVAFDTPDISTGAAIISLPANALVLDMWVFCESATDSDAGTGTVQHETDTNGDAGVGAALSDATPGITALGASGVPALYETAGDLIFTHSGGTWSQGSVRVIVLLLEAAA